MSPAMKAGDFKPCALCGKGVMHAGVPIFYRVQIESMGINLQEVQRTAGMEQFMGGYVAIARVLHDPDIATPIVPAVTALVCQSCSTKPHIVARLAEAS
jgi:hypothetical protein